jgi:hypothetical protein
MRSGYPWLPCAGGNAKHRDDPGRTCSTERPSETRPPRPSFLRFGGVPAAAPQQTQRRWARARLRRHRSVVLCQPEAVVLAPASCQHQEGEQEVAPLPREQLWGREPWTRGGSRRWPSSEPGGGARSLAQATSFPPPRTRGSSLCRATSAKDANAESSEQEDFPLMAAGAAAWRSPGIMSGEP